MAKINWFPGHMNKALTEMKEEVKNVDLVVYVLDARAPFSTLNPEFISIIGEKPVIYVFNKADLVDEKDLTKYKSKLKKENTFVISLNSTQSGAIKQIVPVMVDLCSAKIEKYRQKGIKTNLRAIVIGVPNSGKSTLINNLCGVRKVVTGDKAGVTRGKQWVSLKNGFEICDTPGTLYPNIIDQNIAHNLAYIGSIKNEVVDVNELAVDFLKFMIKFYPINLIEKYGLESIIDKDITQILEDITEHKHCLLRGGEPDYDRCCMAIIDDFRKGRLGKIILDNYKG